MSPHRYFASAMALLLCATGVDRARGQDAPAAPATTVTPTASTAPTAPAEGAAADSAAASYSLGLYLGGQLRASGLEGTVSVEQLQKGLHDGLGGKAPSEDDKARMSAMLHAGRDTVATQNRAQAKDFLEQNAKAQGVVTTASGLQYTILKPGDAVASAP